MMIGTRGIAHISTGEISIRIKQLSSGYLVLGRSYIFGIPLPTIFFIAAVIIASVIAKYTKFGRALYAGQPQHHVRRRLPDRYSGP